MARQSTRTVRGASLLVAGLVLGLAAPAAAHQATTIAHKISGSSIKKHSISGDRLKPNTITGSQIKESTLRLPPLVWTPLVLTSGWSSGRDNRVAAWTIDAQGVIRLKGGIKCVTACSTTAFTLPAGLHPNDPIDLPTYTSTEHTGEIFIGTNGGATVYDTNSAGGDSKTFTSLDGLTFTLT